MTDLLRDVRYAYRLLMKSRGATIIAVLALALGIGANAGTFIGLNAVILDVFPYPDLDRIMTLWETPKGRPDHQGVAPANYIDWTEQNRPFEELAAYRPWTVNLTGADRPQAVAAAKVTPGFFSVLGMKPNLGRSFRTDEAEPGNDRVAILSDGFWRNRLDASPDTVGRTISLGGQRYTVVGVMPSDFDYPLATEVWVPLGLTDQEKDIRDSYTLLALGRLKPGVNRMAAATEMKSIAEGLQRQYPRTNEGRSIDVMPLREMANQETGRFLTVMFGASLFLLALAGTNVASIQLARATGRQKAIAIQFALGATRFRVARSLMAESILLALAGGCIGLWAAEFTVAASQATIPPSVYRFVAGLRNLRVDSTVVVFTLVVSFLTGIFCSLPAVFQLVRGRSTDALTDHLKQGDRSLAGDTRSRLRNALVAFEVAMALLLLIGAGVMVNTFEHMLMLNLGYNPKNVLTMQISLPSADYRDSSQIAAFYDRTLSELSTIPDVKNVSVIGTVGVAALVIEGRPDPKPDEPRPNVRAVGDGYFRTMEIPMVQGRGITAQDTGEAQRVVVINKGVAQHYWPDSDPIGHRIRIGESPWLTVVGVSGDTMDWFFNQPQPSAYVPYRQMSLGLSSMRLMLRTEGDPTLAANPARARIRALDPAEPIYDVKTMEQALFEERSGVQVFARGMMQNALIALFLAVTGIYGVMAYFVNQRTKEIGIRVALGAATSDILKMTFGQAGRLAGFGMLIGIPAAYVLMRILSSALYNVVVVRWTTFAVAAIVLALAALAAAYIPARRAAAVNPTVALRND